MIVLQILAPGKHCDVVWQLPDKLWDHVPEVPQVPKKMYPKYLKSPTDVNFVWQAYYNAKQYRSSDHRYYIC